MFFVCLFLIKKKNVMASYRCVDNIDDYIYQRINNILNKYITNKVNAIFFKEMQLVKNI